MLNYLERLERLARSALSAGSVAKERPSSVDRRALRFEALDPRLMLSVTPGDTVVTFNFTIGGQQESVEVELFNNDAPQTVANFLKYVNSGEYNSTFIHRMVNGFVVQGGGYSVNNAPFSINAPANGIDPSTSHIDTSLTVPANPGDAGIPLEYSAAHPNAIGTLAMARTSAANSATSEWFFNTVDNSTSLGPGGASPDGYAVFGQIIGNGLQVIQQINQLSTLNTDYNANNQDPYFTNVYGSLSSTDQQAVGSLADTPFTNYNIDSGQPITASNLVVLSSVVVNGSITGTVYGDVGGNGVKDAGDQGLGGWTVYIDSNNSGNFDSSDVSATTASDGSYTLPGLTAGTYTVHIQPQANWALSAPASGTLNVTVANFQTTTGQNFGEVLTIGAPAKPIFTPVGAGQPVQYDSGNPSDDITNMTQPKFDIAGVRSGATVQLFDGNTLIGSGTASGTTVTIAISNALSSGPHQITAIQSELGFASSSSPPLSVTIDTTPPVITPAAPPNGGVTVPYTFTVTSDDPSATYSLVTHPDGMTINSATGVVNWTPTNADAGFKQFVVTAADVAGNTSQHTFSVGIDGPPSFATIADQTVNQGSTVTIVPSVSDINGPLTYTLDPNAPQDATFDPATGTFIWTPTAADAPGTHQFTYTVTDHLSLTATQTVNITVIAPPALTTIDSKTIDEGTPLSIPLSAQDQGQVSFALLGAVPAGAAINFTGASAPAGIFITSSGVFTWTPSEAQGPGVYTITVKATGAGGLSSTESFQITVNEVDVPPVLSPISPISLKPGDTLSVSAKATDSDLPSQQLIFSLDSGAPAGATIDPNTGAITWAVPSGFSPGALTMTVRVTEAGAQGLSVTQAVVVNVASGFNGFDLFTTGAVNLGGFSSGLAIDTGVPINSGLSISPAGPGLPGSLPAQAAALQQLAGVIPSGPAAIGLGQAVLRASAVDLALGLDLGVPHDGEGMEKELARARSSGGTGNSPDTGMPQNDVQKAGNFEDFDNGDGGGGSASRKDSSQIKRLSVPPQGDKSRATSFWGTPQERSGTLQVGSVGGRVYRARRGLTNLPPVPSEVALQPFGRRKAGSADRQSTADARYAAAAGAMVMPLLVSHLPENRREKSRNRLGRWLEPLGR